MERVRIAVPTGELSETVADYMKLKGRISFDRPDRFDRRYLH